MKPYQLLVAKTDRENNSGWLPLWMHARDCAGMMARLTDMWVSDATIEAAGLDRENFRKTAILLGMLHDIGKVTSWFQSIITKNLPEKCAALNKCGLTVYPSSNYASNKTPHAYAGEWILKQKGFSDSFAVVVGAHHGVPPDWKTIQVIKFNIYGDDVDASKQESWEAVWDDFISQSLSAAQIEHPESITLSANAQVLFSGLLIISDWISSNTEYFDLIDLSENGDASLYPERIEQGYDNLNFERFESEVYFMDDAIFKETFGFLPNDVQRTMINIFNNVKRPGIVILEAQMGVGKTEAALATAEIFMEQSRENAGESGIYFGMPTQATSNGIFPRILDWLNHISDGFTHTVRLAHGAAELNEDYHKLMFDGKADVDFDDEDKHTDMVVHEWFSGSKKALLADFVVGTVDQFLMSALKRRHFMLRHFGLSGKVVIIDECHAYDAYMNQYLDRAIAWMAAYRVPVILLSATLPAVRRKELVQSYVKTYRKFYPSDNNEKISVPDSMNYPLLTWSDGSQVYQQKIEQKVVEKQIAVIKIKTNQLNQLLLDKLSDGGCAVIIVNTVRVAQQLYDDIRENLQGYHVILYHAQFVGPDRVEKEQEILARLGKASNAEKRDKTIVIGTQVLEQSLDYDADLMVTQWCPMDLLIQRVGRLHRHDMRKRPEKVLSAALYILENEDASWDDGSKAVYGDYLLMRTEKLMPETITLPTDIPKLVQDTYDEKQDFGLEKQEAYEKAKITYKDKINNLKRSAKDYLMREPNPEEDLFGIIRNKETSNSEKQAEATVRAGDPSIEVLVMRRLDNVDQIDFLPWRSEGVTLLASNTPSSDEGRLIAKERLRLPHAFSYSPKKNEETTDILGQQKKTIDILEQQNNEWLHEWQKSPWLKGELILLLDQNLEGNIGEYAVKYSRERGLEYEKRQDDE